VHVIKGNIRYLTLHYYYSERVIRNDIYLGKASQHHVRLVSGNATRIPEVNGECKITAAHSYLDARSIVGTVPILCPYRTIFSGLRLYFDLAARHTASMSA
jgi:hypothetical protein